MAQQPQLPTRELISPALYERFCERIADELAERPLVLDPGEHRADVARRVQSVGGADAYEILGLDGDASAQQVTVAYTQVARRVHPVHAAALDLPEPVLRLLFEHATRAYLTLSDPERRRRYDGEQGRRSAAAPASEEELLATRRQLAQKSYERARGLMKTEQYHYVVELLRDAVRWDPRPELHALLGEAQSRNPRWLDAALENLGEAVRLAPREVAYRLRLAQVLEEAANPGESRKHYEEVLARFPNHPEALAGLERLTAAAPSRAR
jgi:tetratricopeptide (TPR) repeat protein